MDLLKELPELVKAEVISEETADRIRAYYRKDETSGTNRLFIVFGILGAILVGLGIILIVANNWDEFSRSSKTLIAFAPLILGQMVCGWVLVKKSDSTAWREGSAAFLFFAMGACIALVGQIYHIPGDTRAFMLTWMLLSLPLVYLMRSSMASLLYLAGITNYASGDSSWAASSLNSNGYWVLLVGILPHYYYLYRTNPRGNFMIFHHWMIPLSVVFTLGMVSNGVEAFIFMAYVSLLGCFYLIGNLDFFANQKSSANGYQMIGSLGTTILLLILSFEWFWDDLSKRIWQFGDVFTSPEGIVWLVFSVVATVLLGVHLRQKSLRELKPLMPIYLLVLIAFLIGLVSSFAVVLMNIYILLLGILIIKEGAGRQHLGLLNYGLLMIAALVACRFFDTDISFLIRGILFLVVGVGFFTANFWMYKKIKSNA